MLDKIVHCNSSHNICRVITNKSRAALKFWKFYVNCLDHSLPLEQPMAWKILKHTAGWYIAECQKNLLLTA